MDRQSVRNSNHQLPIRLVNSNNDNLPSTSRPVGKNCSRNANYNKQPIKNNGSTRNQNKLPRARESKSFAQQLRESVDTSRNYVNGPRRTNFNNKPNKNVANSNNYKERFVQANCQFVMSGLSDNSIHLHDPDEPIKWDMVEEVIFTTVNNNLYCPICLSYPTAAKMTFCGHVFCWACILGWINVGEKESNSCPLCFKMIKKSHLKSVNIIEKMDYSINDYLTFSLMKIRKNSTIALPINCIETDQPLGRLSRNHNSTLDLFAKMFTASPGYVSALIEREMDELNKQLNEYEMDNMTEVCFVMNALDELEQRRQQLKPMESLSEQFSQIFIPDSTSSKSDGGDDYIYFYQSDDGQAIYLHSINVRMLKHEFGNLKNCPPTITAKVVELHGQSVNEDLRRRNAHLRHLPLRGEYKMAEVVFDTSIVTKSTLNEFNNEINNRNKNRKRKEKAQKIRDRKIEVENEKKFYGIYPDPTFQLDNVADFPEYQFENNQMEINISPTASTTPELGTSPSTSASTEFSFARMLSSGGNDFDPTLRKKTSSPVNGRSEMVALAEEDEDGLVAMSQPMNLTLGDFFDQCVKTAKKGKKGKNRK